MFKIKQIPEDFKVKEFMKFKLDRGGYLYFILKKRNYNTLDAIAQISNKLKVDIKRFGFAGNKDKKAITQQYVSVFNINKENLDKLNLKDIEIKSLGYSDKPISIGSLDYNEFEITVRNLDSKNYNEFDYLENYFDEQRFGFNKNNQLIGKAIIKKEFEKACKLLNLYVKNNDYINVLKSIGIKKLRFYIHAFQSDLFNKVLQEYLKQNKVSKNFKIPLINFDTRFKDRVLEWIYKKILQQEDVKLEDFLIRQLPELISDTVERNAFVKIKNFKIDFYKDELNKGRLKAVLKFRLPKGAYATLVVKKLFS